MGLVLNPGLAVCNVPGIKAEMIPDWLLTGIIWQKIWGVGQRVVVETGVAGWVLTPLGAVLSVLSFEWMASCLACRVAVQEEGGGGGGLGCPVCLVQCCCRGFCCCGYC